MPTRWEVTKAVRRSGLPAPARLVMLVLADVAEVGTAEIPEQWTPSLRVLAKETGLNESTVKRHLIALELAGWVKRDRPSADAARQSYERTRYCLLVPIVEGAEGAQAIAQTEPSQGAEEAQPGRTERPYKGSDLPSDLPLAPQAAPEAEKAPKSRGTRIPDDFHVTPKMREWAMANVPQLAGSRETEKFKLHWQSESGAKAVKLNWELAWRKWLLIAAERHGSNGNGARASPESSAPRAIPPNERCPRHRDQRAGKCRHCTALEKSRPRGGDP